MVDTKNIPKKWENVIPIKSGDPDPKKNKVPLINWLPYKTKIYPKAELKKFEPCNHAVMCGITNNNLLILDWDFKEGHKYFFKTLYQKFSKEFPDLADTYIVETPHGYHFYYYMDDFLETRHLLPNRIFKSSKKLKKDIFKGTIQTKYYEHLAGWDILGQKGYALIPPSKTSEDNEYILKNDTEICKITLEEFNQVKEFFLLDKIKKPRKPFIDLMNGVMDIETYSIETGQKEFVYWKNLFREMWHYSGMEPYEVYRFLEKNQDAFDKETCDTQLQHHPYTDNPLSTEYMKKYFPNYYTNKTTIKNTEIVLKNLITKVPFNKDDILKEIDKITSNTTDTKLLVDLFIKIPSSEIGFLNQVKELLSDKLEFFRKPDLNKLLKHYIVDAGKFRELEVKEGEWSIEDFNKFAEDDDFEIGNILKIIKYEDKYILETDKGIHLYNGSGSFQEIINKPLIPELKTIDDSLSNIELFTFNFNGFNYRNKSLKDILKEMEPFIQNYSKIGRDIIKKYFNFISDKIENRKPEYIIGFNDGWKLPQLEKEEGYTIISYTDIDRIAYNNAKNCIKYYSDKEKEAIIENLEHFLEITQTPSIKLLKIIAWSMASVFRLPIIDYFKIFPHLYNYGERNAGKGSLEEFWIVHFHGFYKKLLPSKTIDSPSRLEDYIASSTFPIVITEVDGQNIRNTISIIKEHATDNTDFERKKSATELEFRKTKTAGLCLDSNIIIKEFNDSALNSKCVMNEFDKKDIPEIDFEWKKLFRKLKKEKLFSFIYDNTKEWDDDSLFKIFDDIINQTKEQIFDYKTIEKGHPRILSIYQIYLFGLYIWRQSFGFPLEELLGIDDNELIESLISGRKIIPRNLLDQFIAFCKLAIAFDKGDTDDKGNFHKGDNPHFLNFPLNKHQDGSYYAFTQNNLRDFNEYSRDFGKYNYNSKELVDKLEDGLDDKENIIYVNKYLDGIKTRYIQINKNLF